MRELSEKELLLLSNYLYMDCSTKYGSINEMLDSCRDENGAVSLNQMANIGAGGGMKAEECYDIIREMDAQSGDFKALEAVRTIDDGGIRAVCFASPGEEAKATVVFRGTGGGYEAWADNLRGEYMSETDMQKLADDFVRYDCGVYDDLTVSGHSKGGNLAQFAITANRDRVNRCISFDGQGFGKSASEEYRYQMDEASYRTKSVSGDKDYVNILLTPLADEMVYVVSGGESLADYHSPYVLYKSCEFDEDGNIVNLGRQNPVVACGAGLLKRVVAGLDSLPDGGNRNVSELLAACVAGVMSNDRDDAYKKERLNEAWNNVKQYTAGLFGFTCDYEYEDVATVTDSLYFDHGGLTSVVIQMREMIKELSSVASALSELRASINYKAASRLAVDIRLRKQENEVLKAGEALIRYADSLEHINRLYTGCEAELTEMIASASFA